ncbi:hypothetical protein KBI23_22025 [bacterium]|nr:hypothetical protein [bacterium]MBP9808271.1 hypothetical protein [bacterium]
MESSDIRRAKSIILHPSKLVDLASPYGTITELAPAVQFEHSPQVDILPVRPFGADKPIWWR